MISLTSATDQKGARFDVGEVDRRPWCVASVQLLCRGATASGAYEVTLIIKRECSQGATLRLPALEAAAADRLGMGRAARDRPGFLRDVIVAGLALVFSILFVWYSRNTGHSFWVYWAPFILAGAALVLGIPVYKRQRPEMTQPAAMPPYPSRSSDPQKGDNDED